MAKIVGFDYDNGDKIAVYVEYADGRQKFVIERHGRWIHGKCTRCGQVDFSKPNYCSNCGANMQGGINNE